MKTLPTLHKEHFEAWLFAQPDNAGWKYSDCQRCIGATFVLSVYHAQTFWGSRYFSSEDFHIEERIPDWLLRLINEATSRAAERRSTCDGSFTYVTAPILRECWREMFPEPAEDRPLTITPAKEQVRV